MPYFELKKQLALDLSLYFSSSEMTAGWIEKELTSPPQGQSGHIALPCFSVAKVLEVASDKVAESLGRHFSSEKIRAVNSGPYVTFRWDIRFLYEKTLERIFAEAQNYGADGIGNNLCVVFEYCSPNVARKLAFQHIRSTLVGNTLANTYDFLGYRTKRINFIGDWGTQFARLLAGMELWGDRRKVQETDVTGSMDHLSEILARYQKEIESRPELSEIAVQCLKRLEEHNLISVDLWRKIRSVSITSMETTLERMGIRFQFLEGESRYIQSIEKTLYEVKEKAKALQVEGAWIVEVEGLSSAAVVQKRDGTTLYLTRDIAAAIDRYHRFAFHEMYYVVSEQQKLHFQLLFGVLKKMAFRWSDSCHHLPFGTLLFRSDRIANRNEKPASLDDLLNEARGLALAACTKKNPHLQNAEQVAERLGMAALVFATLSAPRQTDITFDWDNLLAVDGETGPYVLYALSRCYSLLVKAGEKKETDRRVSVESYEFSSEEEALVLSLAKFRSVLHSVVDEKEPYLIARYLIQLAHAFNRFWSQVPVLQATDLNQRRLRLNLVRGTCQVLENGLKLLGIKAPGEM